MRTSTAARFPKLRILFVHNNCGLTFADARDLKVGAHGTLGLAGGLTFVDARDLKEFEVISTYGPPRVAALMGTPEKGSTGAL